ncbi:MAG: segregation/condensation protein A [Spirochaetales bacterium]|jgi:segregation and condensation protein A|nr:segregation/condensation protein A [Spirochaetales bacterium]
MEEENTKEEKTQFRIRDFEGPLDLLLFLIRKSEVNIYDIPLAQITEQYLSYLDQGIDADLENLTDFFLMAATLLYIKSRMLLPVEIDMEDGFEDPRQGLVEQLIEYQKFKKITNVMAELEEQTAWQIERKKKQPLLSFPEDGGLWDKIDVWDLLQAFSRIISGLSSERIINLYEEITVNEKLSLLNELLEDKPEFLFTDLITHPGSFLDVVCAFLAILEAVKIRNILIYQNRLFGDIRIARRSEETRDE